ncbi:MAG: GntR family transcriptional regulator [Chitinivibrionales bacterium]|nr:GntR family transcriptional regulator [Chitinivibrionales bacterium]
MSQRRESVSRRARRGQRVADIRAYIEEEIARCRRDGLAKLPTVAAMASACGVSQSTVARQCRALAAEGVLECRRGAGVFLADTESTPMPQATRVRPARWRATAEALRGDIEAGQYIGAGALPTAKELGARYGVCHHTLRQALDHLVHRGVLRYERKRYAPVRQPSPVSMGRIVLIARGWWRWKDFPAELSRSLRLFESACGELGIVPAVVLLGFREHRLVPIAGADAMRYARGSASNVLGFIVRTGDCADGVYGPAVSSLVDTGSRIAVWDRRGNSTVASQFGPRAHVFRSTEDYRAGEQIGDAVIRAGYRAVWYVNPFFEADWSRDRCRGLTERAAAAGVSVRAVELAPVDAPFFDPDEARGSLQHARQRLLDTCIDTDDPSQEQFGYALSQVLGELTEEARRRAMRRVVARLLRPHLKRIAQEAPAAVVGCSDTVAQECKALLAGKGGGKTGVYGFDDSFAATLGRFSSYNFNDMGVIRALIASILYPCASRPGPARNRRERRIEGFVTVRDG